MHRDVRIRALPLAVLATGGILLGMALVHPLSPSAVPASLDLLKFPAMQEAVSLWTVILIGVVLAIIIQLAKALFMKQAPEQPAKHNIGNITLDALRFYNGYDYMKPLLVAIKGKVYDVTNSYDTYAPGKSMHMYAGREVARALAQDSLDEADCSDELQGLSPQALQRLDERIAEFDTKYDAVGQVVAPQTFTREQLATFDGSDPALPMYLSIQGTVYDISKGKQFYGPDGVYPFAGKEVARAFALNSTDLDDCNDKVDDLSYTEKESLRDWTAKFNFKYPIVGKLLKSA